MIPSLVLLVFICVRVIWRLVYRKESTLIPAFSFFSLFPSQITSSMKIGGKKIKLYHRSRYSASACSLCVCVWGEREAQQGIIHFCSLNNQFNARPEKEE
jgi:hypothetical protein